jgi:hypothetical protein
MNHQTLAAVVAAFITTGVAAQSPEASAHAQNRAQGDGAVSTPHAQSLRRAADSLRESIQALGELEPITKGRNEAILQAEEALIRTQNAIVTTDTATRNPETSARDEPKTAAQPETSPRTDQETTEARRGGSSSQAAASWNGDSTTSSNGAGTPSSNGESAPSSGQGSFATLLVAGELAADANLADGCWARVYGSPQFRGSPLTLVGPVDVPRIAESAAGRWDAPASLVVGPGAKLVGYRKGEAVESTVTISAGQRLADLGDTVPEGLFASMDSMRLACSG